MIRRSTPVVIAAIASGLVFASHPAAAATSVENTCEHSQDLPAKIAACTSLIRRGGKRTDVFLFYRSAGYFRSGECDKALADNSESARLTPRSRPSFKQDVFLVQQYRAWILKECFADFDGAIAAIEAGFRHNPNHPDLFRERGNVYLAKGDRERAFADFELVIKYSARPFVAWAQRAASYNSIGEHDNALRDADKSISLNGKFTMAYVARSFAWRAKGEYDKALADAKTAIAHDPKDWTGYYHQAAVLQQMGDLEASLAVADKGIEVLRRSHGSSTGVFMCLRGDINRYRAAFASALADFEQASRPPSEGLACADTGRGLTYERMGDSARARSSFEAALKRAAYLFDTNLEAQTTARARLAALDSGEAPPMFAPAPVKAASPTSVPTPVAAPAAIARPVEPARVQATAAKQGRRVALVIGNSAYQKVPALKNPQSDAAAVAASLRNVGFDVVSTAEDTTKDKLIETIRNFANEADRADWAMIYYAGHGIEVNGQNYLIPVDAALKADRDVQFEAVAIDQIMATIDGARKIKLIVLDACRDNPFAPAMQKTGLRDVAQVTAPTAGGAVGTRSVGRGLGEVKVSGASLVVFAAKHGQTALDGDGRNSPFALALVQRMAMPGVEINKIFRLVRDDVMEATAGRQEPFTYGSLPGKEDFFFVQK